jgi:hypothetical protein
MENTKTSKVYAIPDSGLFLVDYLTPTVSKQVLRAACTPLFNLINNNNKDIINGFNSNSNDNNSSNDNKGGSSSNH